MSRIALATAREALPLDDDLPPLIEAFAGEAVAACWDDAAVDWSRFDLVLLRSTWDYVPRLGEFLDWCERVAAQTRLLNPPALVRWALDWLAGDSPRADSGSCRSPRTRGLQPEPGQIGLVRSVRTDCPNRPRRKRLAPGGRRGTGGILCDRLVRAPVTLRCCAPAPHHVISMLGFKPRCRPRGDPCLPIRKIRAVWIMRLFAFRDNLRKVTVDPLTPRM